MYLNPGYCAYAFLNKVYWRLNIKWCYFGFLAGLEQKLMAWKIHTLITATFFQVRPCPYLVNTSLNIQVSFFKF